MILVCPVNRRGWRRLLRVSPNDDAEIAAAQLTFGCMSHMAAPTTHPLHHLSSPVPGSLKKRLCTPLHCANA
jgi:hypothetical protein